MMRKNWVQRKQSMPISVVISVFITIVLMIMGVALTSVMILHEKISYGQAGIILKILITCTVFAGARINTILQNNNMYLVTGIFAGTIVLIILISASLAGIQITDSLISSIYAMCGAGATLLFFNKKEKKHNRFKMRYR